MEKIQITAPKKAIKTEVLLDGSKSESNRVLIINFLSGNETTPENLSSSDDTNVLRKSFEIVKKGGGKINIGHAGTSMRFLTALLSITHGTFVLTGSERMKQRPIKILVEGLRPLGADIQYLEKEGFPPLKIQGKKLKKNEVEIDGSTSSQYISALLLIAPYLKNGLKVTLKNKTLSLPYLQMTIGLMKNFGAIVDFDTTEKTIQVLPKKYTKQPFSVEADWSGASYWFSFCALSSQSEILLKGLKKNSRQADSVLPELYFLLGVKIAFTDEGLLLKNTENIAKNLDYNFINCPDIAQTYAVSVAFLKRKAKLSGLDNLMIKETDRLNATTDELNKFGNIASNNQKDVIEIDGTVGYETEKPIEINTYNDHRMAMAFAPIALKIKNLIIQNPKVVSKSYPRFWEDMKQAGFNLL